MNNTTLLLLDAKYIKVTFSGMQNYGEEKYEGVTQTWDVLQREVLSSQKLHTFQSLLLKNKDYPRNTEIKE